MHKITLYFKTIVKNILNSTACIGLFITAFCLVIRRRCGKYQSI